MRTEPSVLHMDLDAFFASVEQRDKPSLRGKPVIVGGLGPRGVVATASYEARAAGVRSAMPTAQARRRCPNAAYLFPRFGAYAEASRAVMDLLGRLSPLVEPLSLDEAFVDLASPGATGDALTADRVREIGAALKGDVVAATGLVASVGAGTSKFIAKLACDLNKPDGLLVIEPGAELDLLRPMPVTRLWGVGPATAARLHRAGLHLIGELERISVDELTRITGQALGAHLHRLARAEDDRPVVAERESKSVSIEDTFDHDIAGMAQLLAIIDVLTVRLVRRLERDGLSGRTITVKVRLHDFTTLSRSHTLPGPTDDARTIARIAKRLLGDVETVGGVRLLGVGVSGLADWVQGDLFDELADAAADSVDLPRDSYPATAGSTAPGPRTVRVEAADDSSQPPAVPVSQWLPGQDVIHDADGPGWVWGSGRGRVTVRFETAGTPPGPVRTLAADDPALRPA